MKTVNPSSNLRATPSLPSWFQDRRTLFQAHESVSCEFLKQVVSGEVFRQAPLTIAEVGSRGGSDPLWSAFGDQRRVCAFEPGRDDPASSPNLDSLHSVVKNVPLALWCKPGPLRINLPRHGENASVFRPNLAFFRRLPRHAHMKVRRSMTASATTLDKYAAATGMEFDLLSLDVQGAELGVLQGALRQLRTNVMAVIAEVAFVELYRGQPRFREVDCFMEKQGFFLHDLDLRRWEKCPGPVRSPGMKGQIIYGDALYFRDPITNPAMARALHRDRTRAAKFIALAELLGAVDLAVETVRWLRRTGALPSRTARTWLDRLEANHTCALRQR